MGGSLVRGVLEAWSGSGWGCSAPSPSRASLPHSRPGATLGGSGPGSPSPQLAGRSGRMTPSRSTTSLGRARSASGFAALALALAIAGGVITRLGRWLESVAPSTRRRHARQRQRCASHQEPDTQTARELDVQLEDVSGQLQHAGCRGMLRAAECSISQWIEQSSRDPGTDGDSGESRLLQLLGVVEQRASTGSIRYNHRRLESAWEGALNPVANAQGSQGFMLPDPST